jgi:hypothetical protein
MEHRPDPVLRNSRREAAVILLAWLLCTAYCCAFCYIFGYIREGRPLGRAEVRPVLGVPWWFFWGVLAPWAACSLFNIVYAGLFMAEDDLGRDHASELEHDIREAGETGE